MAIPAVALLLWTAAAGILGAADSICVGTVYLPNTSVSPRLDGIVQGDAGWAGASQYVFNNGTSPVATPDAVVQVVRDSGAAYLSFEVNKDPRFDTSDLIVVILRPDSTTVRPNGTAADDRRILIFPVTDNAGNAQPPPTGPVGGGPPREVKYWKDSATFNTTPTASQPQARPNWLCWDLPNMPCAPGANNIRITSSDNTVIDKSYVVEMKIPISTNPADGVNLPSTGTFGLYFNIIRLNGGSALGELRWPTSAPLIGGAAPAHIAVDNHTPLSTDWGMGQIAGTCPGVQVTSVFTNHPTYPADGINANSTNNLFTINLVNSGSADASGVTAVVKSTRFGTGGSFQPLGSPPIPPAGPTGTITSGGGTRTLVFGPWDVLHDPGRSTYLTWPNVCSLVELNATGGSTLIANRYFYWNLHIRPASRFEHRAVIDARALGEPPKGSSAHSIELLVSRSDDRFTLEALKEVVGGRDPGVLADAKEPLHLDDRASKTGNRPAMLQVLARYFPEHFAALRRGEVISTHDHVYCPYWSSGKFIEIEGNRYRLQENLPCFGYVLFHRGEVGHWAGELSGPGVKKLDDRRYVVTVKPRGEAIVTTRIETRKGPPPKPPRPDR